MQRALRVRRLGRRAFLAFALSSVLFVEGVAALGRVALALDVVERDLLAAQVANGIAALGADRGQAIGHRELAVARLLFGREFGFDLAALGLQACAFCSDRRI